MPRILTFARPLRRAAALVALATCAGVTALDASPVAAAETAARTSSTAIADSASEALETLRTWQASGRPRDQRAYIAARDEVAEATAQAFGMPREAFVTAWAGVSVDKQLAMMAAISQLGVPYRSMQSEEGVGFDCSGLMLFAYRAAGVELPRRSGDQIDAADEVASFQAQPGDLVYYPGHISMYLGLGLMVHSPESGELVEIRTLFDRSLRYGDAMAALAPAGKTPTAPSTSLVDRPASVSQ